jgi:hypothetical protein
MDTKEVFQEYMKAVNGEFDHDLGCHPNEQELIDYQRGRLDEGEREKIQSHLVQCDDCLAAFKDVSDFFDPPRAGEETIGQVDVKDEWKTFQRRVLTEEFLAAPAPAPRRTGYSLSGRAMFALAAGVILVIGSTVGWAFWLRQKNQQLAKQLQSEQTVWAAQVKELERENRRLQEQATTLQEIESQLAELRQPQLNVPIYDIFPRDLTQRSTEEIPVNRIQVPSTAKSFALILNGQGQPTFPDYLIEIVDRSDQLTWYGEGLGRDAHGNFVITLNRTFLREEQYRLRLYGRRNERSQRIAEYVVLIY